MAALRDLEVTPRGWEDVERCVRHRQPWGALMPVRRCITARRAEDEEAEDEETEDEETEDEEEDYSGPSWVKSEQNVLLGGLLLAVHAARCGERMCPRLPSASSSQK